MRLDQELTSVTDAEVETTEYEHDAADDLIGSPPSPTTPWAYNAVGTLLSITDSGGTTDHTNDDGDRIDDVGFTFDDNGSRLTDGVRTFTSDTFGRLTGVTASGLSAVHTAAAVPAGWWSPHPCAFSVPRGPELRQVVCAGDS